MYDRRLLEYLRRRQPRVRVASIRDNTRLYWLALLAGLLIALCASAAVHAADKPVSVTAGALKVRAGQSGSVTLRIHVANGWHIFSPNPLVDGVRPSAIQLSGASGITVGTVSMPAPQKVHVQALDKDANVYENTVTAKISLKAAPGTSGVKVLSGTLSYQACSDSRCLLPTKVPFTVSVTVAR